MLDVATEMTHVGWEYASLSGDFKQCGTHQDGFKKFELKVRQTMGTWNVTTCLQLHFELRHSCTAFPLTMPFMFPANSRSRCVSTRSLRRGYRTTRSSKRSVASRASMLLIEGGLSCAFIKPHLLPSS